MTETFQVAESKCKSILLSEYPIALEELVIVLGTCTRGVICLTNEEVLLIARRYHALHEQVKRTQEVLHLIRDAKNEDLEKISRMFYDYCSQE